MILYTIENKFCKVIISFTKSSQSLCMFYIILKVVIFCRLTTQWNIEWC